MKVLATQMETATRFAAIRYLTVRDDAPAPIKDAATTESRGLDEEQHKQNRRVLIVPLLLSYGGIERESASGSKASLTRWPSARSCLMPVSQTGWRGRFSRWLDLE